MPVILSSTVPCPVPEPPSWLMSMVTVNVPEAEIVSVVDVEFVVWDQVKCAWNVSSKLVLVDVVVVPLDVLKLVVGWLLEDVLLVLEDVEEDDVVVLVEQVTTFVEVAEVVIVVAVAVALTRAKLYT
jgi:hypothetical protein